MLRAEFTSVSLAKPIFLASNRMRPTKLNQFLFPVWFRSSARAFSFAFSLPLAFTSSTKQTHSCHRNRCAQSSQADQPIELRWNEAKNSLELETWYQFPLCLAPNSTIVNLCIRTLDKPQKTEVNGTPTRAALEYVQVLCRFESDIKGPTSGNTTHNGLDFGASFRLSIRPLTATDNRTKSLQSNRKSN